MEKNQPTLFELEVLTKYVKDGIEGNKSGITQPGENMQTDHAEIRSTGRSCRRNQDNKHNYKNARSAVDMRRG